MDLKTLNRQHGEIIKYINEIEDSLGADQVFSQAFELSLKVGYLAGVIKIHLKSEDDYLYPSLVKSANSEVVRITSRFMTEMGGLAQTFTKYKEDFNTSGKIKENPREFISRSKGVFDELKKRIESEDRHLYPLLQA